MPIAIQLRRCYTEIVLFTINLMSHLLSPEASSPIKRVKKVSNIKRHSSYEENRGSPLNSSDHRTANLVVSIAGFLTGSIKKENRNSDFIIFALSRWPTSPINDVVRRLNGCILTNFCTNISLYTEFNLNLLLATWFSQRCLILFKYSRVK